MLVHQLCFEENWFCFREVLSKLEQDWLNCWNVVCGKWKLETVQNSTMLQSLLSNQDCDFKSLEIILEIYREVVKSSLGRAISHHIALLKSGSYSYLTLFSRQGNVDTYTQSTRTSTRNGTCHLFPLPSTEAQLADNHNGALKLPPGNHSSPRVLLRSGDRQK